MITAGSNRQDLQSDISGVAEHDSKGVPKSPPNYRKGMWQHTKRVSLSSKRNLNLNALYFHVLFY